MACSCFILLAHFVVELVRQENKAKELLDYDDDDEQAPGDRFGVGFFLIFTVAFVFVAVFSGSSVNSILNCGTSNTNKIVPEPTSVLEDDQPRMDYQPQH